MAGPSEIVPLDDVSVVVPEHAEARPLLPELAEALLLATGAAEGCAEAKLLATGEAEGWVAAPLLPTGATEGCATAPLLAPLEL